MRAISLMMDGDESTLKMTVFWDVASCSLVEIDRRFRGAIALMMEAVSIPETLVCFYEITCHSIPEDSHL
jgi:hypothetical protein